MAGLRCRGSGRVHKGPHLLQAPWGLPGASLGGSLALRTQREGRDVRAVFIGQLHNYCLPITAPNTQISGAVYIKGGSKSNTFEYTTAIYTTLFSLAITLYQQPAFHFFPTLLLFLSYSVSYLSNPRSTHLYSDPYSIPG